MIAIIATVANGAVRLSIELRLSYDLLDLYMYFKKAMQTDTIK